MRCGECERRFSLAKRMRLQSGIFAGRRGHKNRTYTESGGGMMIGELTIINEWIPEQMEPGTVFVLENAGEVGEREDPYWAVLSCPSCGTLGLITRKQMAGLLPTICGSSVCSAQFFIKDEEITPRKPF